jgi:hypothetical protein
MHYLHGLFSCGIAIAMSFLGASFLFIWFLNFGLILNRLDHTLVDLFVDYYWLFGQRTQ